METKTSNLRKGTNVLDTFVDALSFPVALDTTVDWATQRSSRYICFCNVHSIITASVRPDFAFTLRNADLILPDGTPIAWTLRGLGFSKQKRVSGPDFMLECCRAAQTTGVGVFLYGNRAATLDQLQDVLLKSFPGLRLVGTHSPPFRPLTALEDDAVIEEIQSSGAGIVLVSLGCPKQEVWMAAHRGRIDAVMLGVGAAFDYHAGLVKRPPARMRELGFEWLWRLAQEPKRLWKRYLIANSIFICRAGKQTFDYAMTRLIGPPFPDSTTDAQEKGAPDHV